MFIHDANGNGLINLIGAAAGVMNLVNRVRTSTVPDLVSNFVTKFSETDLSGMEILEALSDVEATINDWADRASDISDQLRTVAETVLLTWAASQTVQADTEVTTALEYLIETMETNLVYVTPSGVSVTVEADADNLGDVVVLATVRRGDGNVCQNVLQETLTATLTAESSTAPTLSVTSGEATDDRMSAAWPAGSGADATLSGTMAADGLLAAGAFATWVDDFPTGWIVGVGTPGVTMRQSVPSSHLVVISGTPTAGVYYLVYTDRFGVRRSTAGLNFNATATEVEAALQALPTLASVDVTAEGTAPNYIFTVTFSGVTAVNTLEVLSYLEQGTITASLVQPGDPGAFSGNSLRIDGDGAELSTAYAPLTGLSFDTVYFCHLRLSKTVAVEESSSTRSSSTTWSGTSSSFSTSTSSTAVYTSSSATSGSSSSTAFGQNDRLFNAELFDRLEAAEEELYGNEREIGSISSSSESTRSSGSSLSTSTSTSTSTSKSSSTTQSSSSSPTTNSTSTSTSTSQSTSLSTEVSETSSSESSQAAIDLRIEIVDGIGGNVIHDSSGYPNELRVDVEALGGEPESRGFSFRIPGSVVQPVYIRLRLATPLPAGYSLFIDEVAVVAGTELYTGGPWAAAFAGRDLGILGDTWRIRVANDRRGRVQEWFERFFDMSSKGLLLPVVGEHLVPETVIPAEA